MPVPLATCLVIALVLLAPATTVARPGTSAILQAEAGRGEVTSAPRADAEEPAEGESDEPSAGGEAEAGEVDPRIAPTRVGVKPVYPSLDVYFPEGELDLRLSRLIKRSFFEGQIRYNFFDADISAFLRYRYYGFARSYTVGLFDSIEFENIEELDNDFERTRGGLLLIEWPQTFHRRSFFLFESDRITSSKEEFRFSTNRTNTFIRLGFQVGTPNDERSNAIVGETRAKVERLFTAPRQIGPHGAGFTSALTYASNVLGDFEYVKLEIEGLKRFNLGPNTPLIARVHGGSFFDERVVRDDPDLDLVERLSIPRPDFYRLDGRDNLRGLADARRGTEELHSTVEIFLPWFLDDDRRALGLDWTNFYWVLYGGVGTIGFDKNIYTDWDSYIGDIGFGFEAAVELRGFRVFLSALAAYASENQGGEPEIRLSAKTYR